jgi:hypothetical protein
MRRNLFTSLERSIPCGFCAFLAWSMQSLDKEVSLAPEVPWVGFSYLVWHLPYGNVRTGWASPPDRPMVCASSTKNLPSLTSAALPCLPAFPLIYTSAVVCPDGSVVLTSPSLRSYCSQKTGRSCVVSPPSVRAPATSCRTPGSRAIRAEKQLPARGQRARRRV